MADQIKIDPVTGERIEEKPSIDPATGERISATAKIEIDPVTGERVQAAPTVEPPKPGILSRIKSAIIGKPSPAVSPWKGYTPEIRAAAEPPPKSVAPEVTAAAGEYEAEQKSRNTALAEAMRENSQAAVKAGFTADPSGVTRYMESVGKPLKPILASPEQFAEERANVSRGTSALGASAAGAGDAWSQVADVTGWSLLARTLTGKTKAERTGERIVQTEAALAEADAVRTAKAKQAAGETLTEPERRTLENNKFFAQLGAAAEALRENPGEVGEALLVDLIENAPIYALTNIGTVGAAKALTGAVRGANNSRRLAQALAKGKSAAAAEIKAQKTAALGAKVVKPSMLKTIGIEVAADVPADVAVGMVLEKSRGRDYKASDLVTDLVASGIINVPIGVVKNLKSGGVMSAREFRQVADAFGDIGALATEPAVADILGRLKTLAADEVLIDEGLKVSATGRAKAATPEQARTAGYSEEVAAGPESGRQILGSTEGADVKLRPGADLATLEEEISTARFNVLKKRAEAGGEAEVALLARINQWADAVHAENNSRPPEQRVALPQQSENGNLELLTKVLAQDETGVELVPLVDVPDDIYNDWGKIFNARQRVTPTEAKPGRMRGEYVAPVVEPLREATLADVVAPGSVGEAAGRRPPLPVEEPDIAPLEASVQGRARRMPVVQPEEDPGAMGRIGRMARKPLPQYQLREVRLPEHLLSKSDDGKIKLRNTVHLEDGSRLSGFTTEDQSVFYGYDKNGEQFTLRRESVDPQQIVSDKKNRVAAFLTKGVPSRSQQYQLRGSRTLGAIADQSRLRSIDVAKAVIASGKPMSAQTAAASLGLKGAVAQDAAKRAIPMIKAIRGGKSIEEAMATDALKDIMRKPSEKIKSTILRTTGKGITGTEILTAKQALNSVIRQLQLKADLEAHRQATREASRIRRLIVAASKKNLDPELQGQMLAAVRDAKTTEDYITALTRIGTILSREQLKETAELVRDLLKADAGKMPAEYRDAFKAIADDISSGKGDAAAKKYRAWYDTQADKPPIPKRFAAAMERLDKEQVPTRAEIRQMEPEAIAEAQAHWQAIADAISSIVAAADEAQNIRFQRDALKLDLTVNQAVREIAKENPKEMAAGTKPGLIKQFIRYGSSPEYLIMLAGGRDGILHNVLFKRPAASMSQAYMAREQMRQMMKDFFTMQGKSENDLIKWRHEKITTKLDDGSTLTLTRPEAVSLYATMANDESGRLIRENGIQKWEDKGTGRKSKLSDADIKRIESKMSDFDIKTAEMMLGIFDAYKSELNAASNVLHGYEKFTVENYFPRMASRDYLDKNLTELKQFWDAAMLEQGGFTKERETHDKPLIIADAMNVFDRHINDAAMYANMAVPLRNAARVIGNSDVKQEVAKRLGGGLEKNIEEFLLDASGMNSRAMMDDASKFYRAMLRTLSVGILGYRPTTIINNLFGASTQIYAEIPEKYRADFWKNWTTMTPAQERATFQEMKAMDAYFDHRYSRDPYRLATWGNTEMPETIGTSDAYIKFKKMQDHSMKWMQNAERRAAVAAYKALRDRTTKADAITQLNKRFRDASDASEPVKEYAAHETMILVRRTQNAIDALDKSAFSRKMSENPLAMSAFMFTSQLYKLRDMALMATLDYQRGHITKKEYARKMGLIMTSAAVIPTFASLAWREAKEGFKDRKESEEQNRMGAALMMTLNATEMIDPMVGGVVRAVVDEVRGGMGGANRGAPVAGALAKLARNITKTIEKKDDEAIDAFIAALGAGASVAGVPAAPFEVLGATAKFLRPDDPLIPYYNKKFKIEEKFGIHEPTGRKRSLQQALASGIEVSPEEIKSLKEAEAKISAANRLRNLVDEGRMTEEKAEETIKKLTKD